MLPDKVKDFAAQTHRGVLTTFRLYVDAEYRRQGVYRALDSHVQSEARRRGDVCGLRLYVERNNHVAQQVYSRLDMHRSHYDLFEIDFVL